MIKHITTCAGDSDTVAVLEVSRAQMSPLALLSGGASASGAAALALSMAQVRTTKIPFPGFDCVARSPYRRTVAADVRAPP